MITVVSHPESLLTWPVGIDPGMKDAIPAFLRVSGTNMFRPYRIFLDDCVHWQAALFYSADQGLLQVLSELKRKKVV